MTRRIACLALAASIFLCLAAGAFSTAGPFSTVGLSSATVAAASPPQILGLCVGFAGYYKVGVWTPVEVECQDAARVSLTVCDSDGVPSRVTGDVGANGMALLYVRFGRADSQMTVEASGNGSVRQVFQCSERPVKERKSPIVYRPAIAATRQLIVTVAAEPMGEQEAVSLLREDDGSQTVAVRLEDCRQLPDRWYGYEGVGTVLMSTSRPEILAGLEPGAGRIEALDRWVRMGGELILCVGAQAERVIAPGMPLSGFTPGRFQAMVSLRPRELGALEAFAESSTPIPQPVGGGGPTLRAPRLTDVAGVVAASEGDLPLVVRAPWGLGQVLFVAADLDREPLSKWAGRPLLVAKLLDPPAARAEEMDEGAAMMHYGFNDMAGQLRSALDRFEGVQRVPFWGVALLVVFYILLIGPGDYLLLRKVIRRMQWTWATFPALVLLFGVAAYGLAYGLKGHRVAINQVDLVDVDTATGFVRETTWVNLFTPRAAAFDLSLGLHLAPIAKPADGAAATSPGDPGSAGVLFGWLGLPGEALGGMNPRAVNPVERTETYEFAAGLDAMQGVPIPACSTRSFTARCSATIEPRLRAELRIEAGSLSGTITNTLDFPLSDCLVAYDRSVYQIDALPPGATIELGPNVKHSKLATLLTGQKIVADRQKQSTHLEATPYDRSSTDVAYILRMMTFFEEAGGRRYTGLFNGYQGFVDMSGLLKAGRAVLIAQAPNVGRATVGDASGSRAAELWEKGRPIADCSETHATFYRFVFPVQSADQRR